MINPKTYLYASYLLTLGFVFWSFAFIYNSSFEIDGKRYFSLFDDAMISMKYAWNFVEGRGLVWNRFDRVEGYTNPLWVLIMAFIHLFAKDTAAVYIVQHLGIPIIVGIIYYTAKLIALVNLAKNKYLQLLIATALTVTWYPLSYWTLMGMESGLLTLLILLSFYYSLLFIKFEKAKHANLFLLFITLAYFTRPDSIYLAALIFAGLYYFKKDFAVLITKLLGIYIACIIAHIIFRVSYYGSAVPNTVILKVFGIPLINRVQNGWAFTKLYLAENFVLIVLTIVGMVKRPSRIKTFLGLPVLVTILYQTYVGGDPWYYWRFFLPVMPLIVVISSAQIINLFELIRSKFSFLRSEAALLTFCAFILLLNFLISNERFLNQIFFNIPIYQSDYNKINVNYALRIKEISDEEATVGVFWAGAIPYYSERDGVDFLGKGDRYIARVKPNLSWSNNEFGMKTIPGHNKYDLVYTIMQLQPDFIERADWGSTYVGNHPEFNYKIHKYKELDLYIKNGSNHVREIE